MTPGEHVIWLSGSAQRERWNHFVSTSPWGHLMQAWEWGEFKAALGWQVERVAVERNGQIVAGAQVLLRRLPLLPLTIAYVPKGPLVDLADALAAAALFAAVHQVARRRRALFTRIEPNALDDEQVHAMLRRCGFRPTAQTNQPRSSIVIDLSVGEAALLANLSRTTRKLIRRAARHGVEIVQGGADDLGDFFAMISTTSELKGFPVHDEQFYKQAWQTFHARDAVQLLLAKHAGRVVAAKMICVFGDRSMHLWGGTSDAARDLHASYLLQWEAIKWAMARGCRTCDLWGIPDQAGALLRAGQALPDRQDGLWGVYTFKRGFGGQVEYYVGAYDYPYWRLLYRLGLQLLLRGRSSDTLSRWLEQLTGSRSARGHP
jgi:lipid II:glycine glycyltransferase (peptidoglycan interpeptide bridge formation enzyme)